MCRKRNNSNFIKVDSTRSVIYKQVVCMDRISKQERLIRSISNNNVESFILKLS